MHPSFGGEPPWTRPTWLRPRRSHERLVFTFGWEQIDGAPAIAPGESRVEITFVADEGDTIMTLPHSGVPNAYVERHAAGWCNFLPILADSASAAVQ